LKLFFANLRTRLSGFSIIELMVVLAIVSVLLTLVAPRLSSTTLVAKESVLKENLSAIRRTIDQFNADQGRYPRSMQELVEKRYLRALPIDPITDKSDWVLVLEGAKKEDQWLKDVGSSSQEKARDGTAYASW
jgi:general secretion pathway protein G